MRSGRGHIGTPRLVSCDSIRDSRSMRGTAGTTRRTSQDFVSEWVGSTGDKLSERPPGAFPGAVCIFTALHDPFTPQLFSAACRDVEITVFPFSSRRLPTDDGMQAGLDSGARHTRV